jgi:glyoxylase-like metal-dependent hydrolase (beta-lactamase superfamily II)
VKRNLTFEGNRTAVQAIESSAMLGARTFALTTHLILVDAGAGTWWGGGALGRLVGSLRSAGYTPEEVDIVLLTHFHSDHVGGLTAPDGKRVFPNAEVYVAKAESSFWLSLEIAAKAPKDAQPFFRSAQAIAAPYIEAGKWHTFSGSEPIVDGMQIVPLPGHTPGHTGFEFSSKGQKILFWGDVVHAQRVQFVPSGGHGGLRHRLDCGCADARSIAGRTRARGCFDRGSTYAISCLGSLPRGRKWV